MGKISLATLGVVAVLSVACSSASSRQLPRYGLIDQALSGREPPPTERGRAVVAFAAAQIGKPYCWGGTGPRCFDCSGLVETGWAQVGVRIPRTSHEISNSLAEVAIGNVRAGDILWWPGHVGIYAGHGWMVDALDTRHGVVVRYAADPYRAFRPLPELAWSTAPPGLASGR